MNVEDFTKEELDMLKKAVLIEVCTRRGDLKLALPSDRIWDTVNKKRVESTYGLEALKSIIEKLGLDEYSSTEWIDKRINSETLDS